MARLGAIFVSVCMVLIAGSISAVLFLFARLSAAESAVIGLAVLTALALYNAITSRLNDRSTLGGQIADLSRGTAELARQVAELGRRVAAMESTDSRDAVRTATAPLAAEIGELGSLVRQLADSVADHDAILEELAAAPPPAGLLPPAGSFGPGEIGGATIYPFADAVPSYAGASEHEAATASKETPDEALIALIHDAVLADRVDLYLQPIVTLPQRKVRYYEAMVRLRTASGELLLPADFLSAAEAAGLMPQIDNLMLFRCVQVIRRLLLKNRDIGLFCNISASTLIDPEFFPQMLQFMEANRAVAPALILEVKQSALRGMGPMENEALAALAQRGFRFSVDNVSDLRMEPRELSERGIRFVKVPAALLLSRGAATTDIHPADLSSLLGRFNIGLIAEKIENEGVVVNLLDYEVKFGQGFLFSQPRPVKAEALQGVGDREVVARDSLTRDIAANDEGPRAEIGRAALTRI